LAKRVNQCPKRHYLNPKARVDIKNGQLKAIEAMLRVSRRHVHALMFEASFHFRSLTTTKPITKGRFTLWTMKLSHGRLSDVIGR
jgi:hypothetical protein